MWWSYTLLCCWIGTLTSTYIRTHFSATWSVGHKPYDVLSYNLLALADYVPLFAPINSIWQTTKQLKVNLQALHENCIRCSLPRHKNWVWIKNLVAWSVLITTASRPVDQRTERKIRAMPSYASLMWSVSWLTPPPGLIQLPLVAPAWAWSGPSLLQGGCHGLAHLVQPLLTNHPSPTRWENIIASQSH